MLHSVINSPCSLLGLASPGSAMAPGSSATRAQCRLFNGFGWQGMASPLDPLLQRRLRQLSSPGRAAHSSRDKKAVWPPSSTPFRSCRCSGRKPLPSTSHRGRDGRGFDKLEGNHHGQHRNFHQDRQRIQGRDRHHVGAAEERPHRPRKPATTKTRRRTGSSSAARKSAPPGPRPRTKAATISRSSSTIPASPPRSSPTCSTTKTASPTT
jgi:hypothetical protein